MQPNFLLVDGARALSGLGLLQDTGASHDSLYKGKQGAQMAGLGPYLFSYNPNESIAETYAKKGLGKAWGVLLVSSASFEDLHKHFRKFLMVQTEDYQQMYFRFYDPRVLRDFLPTCSPRQLADFFGPIQMFICEDEDPKNLLIFTFIQEQLYTERKDSGILFSTPI